MTTQTIMYQGRCHRIARGANEPAGHELRRAAEKRNGNGIGASHEAGTDRFRKALGHQRVRRRGTHRVAEHEHEHHRQHDGQRREVRHDPESRIDQQQQRDAASHDERLAPPHAIGPCAVDRAHDERDGSGAHAYEHRELRRQLQRLDAIGRQKVHQQIGRHRHAHDREYDEEPVAHVHPAPIARATAHGGRLLHDVAAQVDADRRDQGAHEEGHAPTPGVQLRLFEHVGEQRRDARTQQRSRALARELPARAKAAAAVLACFEQRCRGGAEFAALREALHEPGKDDQRRGREPDLRIGGCKPDDAGAERHQRDGQRQRRTPARPVGIAPDHDAAERAHHEANGEYGERQQR